jgi:hypothetical protein
MTGLPPSQDGESGWDWREAGQSSEVGGEIDDEAQRRDASNCISGAGAVQCRSRCQAPPHRAGGH